MTLVICRVRLRKYHPPSRTADEAIESGPPGRVSPEPLHTVSGASSDVSITAFTREVSSSAGSLSDDAAAIAVEINDVEVGKDSLHEAPPDVCCPVASTLSEKCVVAEADWANGSDDAVHTFLEDDYWRVVDNTHPAAKEGSIKVDYGNDLDTPTYWSGFPTATGVATMDTPKGTGDDALSAALVPGDETHCAENVKRLEWCSDE